MKALRLRSGDTFPTWLIGSGLGLEDTRRCLQSNRGVHSTLPKLKVDVCVGSIELDCDSACAVEYAREARLVVEIEYKLRLKVGVE